MSFNVYNLVLYIYFQESHPGYWRILIGRNLSSPSARSMRAISLILEVWMLK